jgi:hypothetical protein
MHFSFGTHFGGRRSIPPLFVSLSFLAGVDSDGTHEHQAYIQAREQPPTGLNAKAFSKGNNRKKMVTLQPFAVTG